MSQPNETAIRPPMPLVNDEIIRVTRGHGENYVRLRIWRDRDQPAIVLVTPVPGGGSVGLVTSRVADIAFQGYLHYIPAGMRFFEVEGGLLYLVTFRPVGHRMRLRHADPASTRVPVEAIESYIRTPVVL